jgi:TusA-related sulfurtransferase
MTMKADEKVDIRGLVEPYSLLMLKSVLASMEPGAVLEIDVRDPDTIKDILAIVDRSGEQLLAGEQDEDGSRLWVRKGSHASFPVCMKNGRQWPGGE